jgi:hypothetical protein
MTAAPDPRAVARDERGWPIRMHEGERACARMTCTRGSLTPAYVQANLARVKAPDFTYPPAAEFRINGYCSHECEYMGELESALAAALKERDEALDLLWKAGRRCDQLHHAPKEHHNSGEPCPVEGHIERFLQLGS